jgi:hypothetical protein
MMLISSSPNRELHPVFLIAGRDVLQQSLCQRQSLWLVLHAVTFFEPLKSPGAVSSKISNLLLNRPAQG